MGLRVGFSSSARILLPPLRPPGPRLGTQRTSPEEIALDPTNASLVEPGSALHEYVEVVRTAYDALQDVDTVKALREPFVSFIALADEMGVAGDAKKPWRKRYMAILEEQRARDAEQTISPTDFCITVNLAWVKLLEATKRRR